MPSILKRLRESSVQLWETTQVELQGHYSVEQLQRLDHYRATTSGRRALLVCLLTPVPTIAIVILLDLLRLEPPGHGTLGSPNVWIRQWFTIFFISLCTMEQVWQHLPQLALTPWQLFVIALAGTLTAVGVSFSLSNVVGYPLPFTVVVGTPGWFVVLSALIYLFKREQLHEEPGLGKCVFRYLMVLLCQVVMTMIYPSYNFVYSGLSSTQQTGFVLLLPVLKLVTKNWISRALPDSDDAKPEAVVFNVEIFHALFVSLCMGSTTSGRTIATLMVVDVVQAWLSFVDVMGIVRGLQPLMKKLNNARRRAGNAVAHSDSSNRSLENIMTAANRIIAVEAFQAAAKQHFHPHKTASRQPIHRLFVRTSVTSRLRKTWRRMSGYVAAVVPLPSTNSILPNQPSNPARTSSLVVKAASPSARPTSSNAVGPTESLAGKALPADLASLSPVERGVLVQHTQKLLYVTEYIVLIEYTEVIMPLIYDTLLFAMYYRPNREYYTFLFGVCTTASLHSTAANVLAYATLEFISLVVMALIVWWKLRLSLLHQLAFVLETRMINIQAKLLLWVLDTMQTSIVQLGPDYSFRFEWLHKRPGEDTSSRFQGYSTACSAETIVASTSR